MVARMSDSGCALVLDALARAGLGLPPAGTARDTSRRDERDGIPGGALPTAGTITLLPHQVEAVHRLRPLLATRGGALLADDVGLGKTFVALSLRRAVPRRDVVAPAGLLAMWRHAIRRTGAAPGRLDALAARALAAGGAARVPNVARGSPSTHTAHRAPATRDSPEGARLVIIDEAHHLRNPATRRYAAVADLCRGGAVLLLSATPVHNRASDLAHLLALFLGARAHALEPDERRHFIVRRDADDVLIDRSAAPGAASSRGSDARPRLVHHTPLQLPDAPGVTRALADIAPPVPTRHGQAAAALVALGLVRAWCSSGAACLALLKRRRLRVSVLADILADGRWPTRRELHSFTVGDDALQLGFTALLVSDESRGLSGDMGDAANDREAARAQLARHTESLDRLHRELLNGARPLDLARVAALRSIRAAHHGLPVIAFSQFAETVTGLAHALREDRGVASLTAHGGRVAGGRMSRSELLRRFAPLAYGVPVPPRHERIQLLLTTDLLAEGVNLQDAGIVVHLDMPWTPAALAQRDGRIARLGSPHATVHSYVLAPPGGGGALLRIAARLRRKAHVAAVSLDASPSAPGRSLRPETSMRSAPLEKLLRTWVRPTAEEAHPSVDAFRRREPASCVLGLCSPRSGWLAALRCAPSTSPRLVGGWFTGNPPRTRVSTRPDTLFALAAGGAACPLAEHWPPPRRACEAGASVLRAGHRAGRRALPRQCARAGARRAGAFPHHEGPARTARHHRGRVSGGSPATARHDRAGHACARRAARRRRRARGRRTARRPPPRQ